MEVMTIDQVHDWLKTGQTSPRLEAINDELDLIAQCERMKHNHFTIPNLKKTLNSLPLPIRMILVQRVHELADTMNITLKPGDYESDKFFSVYIEQSKKSLAKLRNAGVVPDEDHFDDQGRCPHDVEIERRIQLSLEYITTLIKGTI